MAKLTDQKTGISYTIKAGQEFVRAYQINPELPLQFGCCNGQCGVCAIKVLGGQENLSRLTKQEKLTLAEKNLESPPYRLACQCAILGDVIIE